MMQEVLHTWEYTAIVTCCCKNHTVITERIFHNFCHIITGKIHDRNFLYSFGTQHLSKFPCCFCSISMDRCICYKNTLILRLIAAPGII